MIRLFILVAALLMVTTVSASDEGVKTEVTASSTCKLLVTKGKLWWGGLRKIKSSLSQVPGVKVNDKIDKKKSTITVEIYESATVDIAKVVSLITEKAKFKAELVK